MESFCCPVSGPTCRASSVSLGGVHPRYFWCDLGLWPFKVLAFAGSQERTCEATRTPRGSTSTVSAVGCTSTSRCTRA